MIDLLWKGLVLVNLMMLWHCEVLQRTNIGTNLGFFITLLKVAIRILVCLPVSSVDL